MYDYERHGDCTKTNKLPIDGRSFKSHGPVHNLYSIS